MKIQNRLTFQFTVITGVILLMVFSLVYIVTVLITHGEFFDRLRERLTIAENIYFEKDELTKSIYEQFENSYLKKLPDEVVQIFNEKNQKQYIEDNPSTFYSRELIEKVRSKGTYRFDDLDHQIIGEYYFDNQGNFVIFVSAKDIYGNERLKKLLWALIVTYVLALLIIFYSGRFYSKNALSPITYVVRQVKKISASNLHMRVDLGKNEDEIAELAVTFNDMLARLESSFESQKTFVSNASHELRTPLTAMIGELQVFLSKDRIATEYKGALQSVLNDAEQMKELTAGLLQMAQIEEYENEMKTEEVRIDELLIECVEEAKKESHLANLHLNFENLPEDQSKLVVTGTKTLLTIAIQNLIRNALKFSENKPVDIIFTLKNDQPVVKILDKGIGIEQDEIQKIFQPFYRSPRARGFSGHGIGLALVEKICKIHHIFIDLKSSLSEGTAITLTFNKEF